MNHIINIGIKNLNEGLNQLAQTLPPEMLENFSTLITILKTLGIVFIIYLIFLVINIILNIRRNLRIKRIEEKIDQINNKLGKAIKKGKK